MEIVGNLAYMFICTDKIRTNLPIAHQASMPQFCSDCFQMTLDAWWFCELHKIVFELAPQRAQRDFSNTYVVYLRLPYRIWCRRTVLKSMHNGSLNICSTALGNCSPHEILSSCFACFSLLPSCKFFSKLFLQPSLDLSLCSMRRFWVSYNIPPAATKPMGDLMTAANRVG